MKVPIERAQKSSLLVSAERRRFDEVKVLFLPEVENYLYELIEILFRKEYFGFKESAVKYVIDFEKDITTNLPNKVRHPAPPYFDRYGKGMFYASFRKNKTTQWYVFFNIYAENVEMVYLVRYVSNNHAIAQFLFD